MQISTVSNPVSPAYGNTSLSQMRISEKSYIQHENIDIYYHENDGNSSVQLSLNRHVEYHEYTYTAQGLSLLPETNSLQLSGEIETSDTKSLLNVQEQYLDIIKKKVEYLLNQLMQNSKGSSNSTGLQSGNRSSLYRSNTRYEYTLYSESTFMLFQTSATDGDLAVPDYYSPEKTAGRIVNFALSFYAGGDRNEFAAMVKDAVMKGFQEAGAALGGYLPPEAQETLSLVMNALDSFTAGEKLNLSA